MALEGQQIGHYRLVRLLGSGGMGEVYLAEDVTIQRQVAIKVIRAEAGPYPDVNAMREAARLFQREMKAIATLDHPHILPLYDYGESRVNDATLTYMVMPYRPEGSLTSWLRQRGSTVLSPQDVAFFITQAADALQYAHDRHIIHLDVKPANFLLRSNPKDPTHPTLLLADFGVAKQSAGATGSSRTIRGTPTTMAPEQWSSSPVPATDQYALAVMAYALLAGRPPFRGSMEQLMFKHFQEQVEVPSASNPHLTRAVDDVLLRALAKRPEDRFPTISAFAAALEQAVQALPTQTTISPVGASAGDIRATLAISKTEAVAGTNRTLTLPGGRKISVSVPPGAFDGQVIHLSNLGDPTGAGSSRGSLILTLTVQHTEPAIQTPLASTPSSDPSLPPSVLVSPPRVQSPTPPGSNPSLPSIVPASDPNSPARLTLPLPCTAILARPHVSPKTARPSGRIILLIGLAFLVIVASGVGLFSVIHANQVATANAFDTLSKILVAIGGFLVRYGGITLAAIGGFLAVYVLFVRLLLPIASSLRTAFTSSNDKTESSTKPLAIPTALPTSAPSLSPTIISPPPPQPTQPTIPQAPDQEEQSVQSAATATYRSQWRPPEEPIGTWTPTQAEDVVPGPSTVMFSNVALPSSELKDFFISYTRTNFAWAAWIAQQLEEAGYSILLPPWGLRSDSDFELEMQKAAAKAKRIIAVLSPAYLNILNAQPTWIETFKRNTTIEPNTLILIRVQECGSKFRKLLESINHLNIVGEDEVTAQAMLLAGIHGQGVKLTVKVSFPGSAPHQPSDKEAGSPKQPVTTRRKPTGKAADQTTNGYESPPSDTNTTLTQQKEANAKLMGIEKNTEPVKLQPAKGIKIFLSYSHKDKALRDELDKWLRPLQYEGLITSWHDGKIEPGKEWPKEIEIQLRTASIILLLVSSNFMASDYCYSIEMRQAVERHEAGEARVIPVILRYADWHRAPFGKLQALPENARPVMAWPDTDEAFFDVVRGIRKAVEELSNKQKDTTEK